MAVANPHLSLKVLERCAVTPVPTPGSPSPPPHPLTLFDIIWYPFGAVQRVYFYSLPSTTASDFLQHHLPNIKRSLSLALRRFYLLAGRLVRPAGSSLPSFRHSESGSDSVELTVAESDDDFAVLTADAPKAARRLRNLVPHIPSPPLVDDKGTAVSAFQVTVFPRLQEGSGVGVAIGVTVLHAAADGSSAVHFVKTWAAICRGEPDGLNQPPCYDKSAVKRRTDEMAEAVMAQLDGMSEKNRSMDGFQDMSAASDILRATFRLTKADIELLRHRASATGSPSFPRFSSFSLAAGLAWATLLKARGIVGAGDDEGCTEWLIFPCDLRGRFDPPVPQSYFGNLLGGCLVGAKREDLIIGDNGFAAVVGVIQSVSTGLRHAEGVRHATELLLRGLIDIPVLRPTSIAGSPRLGVHGVDFGWGKPCKVEVVSIDTTGAFSLADSRDEEDGGIEVGVVLPVCEMARFADLFADALHVCGTVSTNKVS